MSSGDLDVSDCSLEDVTGTNLGVVGLEDCDFIDSIIELIDGFIGNIGSGSGSLTETSLSIEQQQNWICVHLLCWTCRHIVTKQYVTEIATELIINECSRDIIFII
jgi:hypothetical protein